MNRPVDPADPRAKGPPFAARAEYAPEPASWSQDRIAAAERSRKLAWTVAGVAAGVVVLQTVALLFLIPLKQAVPYTVTVDRQTGYVQTTPGLTLPRIAEADAVKQAFLTQYVLARETFDLADYRENYRRTLLWSDGNAAASYERDWDRDNPDGVQARYRATTTVAVVVKAVQLLSADTAVIRFETIQSEGVGGTGLRQPWSATVTFRAAQRPLSAQDRYLNPLGFQITGYRRDAELAAPVPMALPTPVPQAPPPAPLDAASGAVPGAASAASGAAPMVVPERPEDTSGSNGASPPAGGQL